MFRKIDIIQSLFIAILMIVLFSLESDINEWMTDSSIRNCINEISNFIKKHFLINLIFACSCVNVFFWRGIIIWKDHDFRLYRILLILLGFEVIYLYESLFDIVIVGRITYGALFAILLSVNGIVVGFRICKYFVKKKLKQIPSNGFSTDDINLNNVSKNLQDYAKSIVAHLLNTDTSEHSFALGVTGEWGGGKTTFLELLDSMMDGKAEKVWFNPWMCRTPEQVAEDFFLSLHKTLSPKYSSLSRPIRDYAQYISNATISIGGGFLSRLTFALPRESLKMKKDRLSDRLSKLELPVVVFIDDLDRLEMDEVFEVLRLIRNTADLKNVVYVVAYDKDYVTNVLLEKKIENAAAYLEKIFPVEVHQPKVEDIKLQDVLYKELSSVSKYGESFARKLWSKLYQNEKKLIFDILDNYRRVKRFARRYVLIVDYLIETEMKEIKTIDLFFIELLQGYDKQTYDLLMHEPLTLLYEKGECYKLRPNIYNEIYIGDDKKHEYKGEKIWKPKTPELLNYLFLNNNHVNRLSIVYIENFDKYFLLGISELKLSKVEFNKLFDKYSDPVEVINKWMGKYFTSVLFQFASKDINTLDSDGVWRYMTGMMHIAYLSIKTGDRIEGKIVYLLYPKRYNKEKIGIAKGYILLWFYKMIENPQTDYIALSQLLKMLYQSIRYEEETDERHEPKRLIISNDDIKSLLVSLISQYLNLNQELTATDILKEKSNIGKIFQNCCVCEVESSTYDFDKYDNVAFPAVVKWFSKKKQKPSLKDYNEAIDKMFYEGNVIFDDENDYYSYMEDRYNYMYDSYFGTDSYWYNKFKSLCFDDTK